ncbi:beta-1,3-galactosyltransferase 6-like [Mercenaria mercenaria]|uniref:beta-1,3-galactosyltransferase 6-like n=1 Tax=Mercenaria mercenaria TaxID=6596 RepID=UPI00234F362A|nr:beta-1,3-galactosyltransferase 6-like [Mercenaria mercenaria]
MVLRMILIRLRRKCSPVFLFGLLACITLMVLLTFCHTPCELEAERDLKSREAPIDRVNVLIATNLLVVVMSAPSHFDVRNVIRETWAQALPNGASVRFVVGCKNLPEETLKNIKQEEKIHRDLLMLEDIEESYSSLTKKLISTLKWVNNHVKYNFFMKVDEDSFVRVEKILDELLTKPQEKLYWGFFDGRAHVKRSGKWAEKDFVLCDRYLPYALGGGYVISKDLVAYVAKNADLFKQLNNEDVSLGTWLGPLDVNRIHDVNFDTEYKSRGCYNSYLVTHKKPPEELQELQKNLGTLGRLCAKENRVRLSYNYNWKDLPTKCCERTDHTIP